MGPGLAITASEVAFNSGGWGGVVKGDIRLGQAGGVGPRKHWQDKLLVEIAHSPFEKSHL